MNEVEVLKDFEEYLKGLNKSKRTVETYVYFVSDFADFLQRKGKSILNFVPYDLFEYLKYLSNVKRVKIGKKDYEIVRKKREDGISTYTENTIKSAVIKFIEFMGARGYDHFDKMLQNIDRYEIFKLQTTDMIVKTQTRALDIKEINKLLKIFEDKPEHYSGIVFLFWLGARSGEMTEKIYLAYKGEVISGVRCYVDFKNQKLKIETEKRRDKNRFRVIPWCDEIHEEVKMWCDYIKEKRKTWKAEHFRRVMDCVFKSRKETIRSVLGYYVSPKFARVTFQTEMLRRGVQPIKIAYWLGHKLPKLTVEEYETIRKEISTGVSSIIWYYTDPERACESLREEIVYKRKHYLFEVL